MSTRVYTVPLDGSAVRQPDGSIVATRVTWSDGFPAGAWTAARLLSVDLEAGTAQVEITSDEQDVIAVAISAMPNTYRYEVSDAAK